MVTSEIEASDCGYKSFIYTINKKMAKINKPPVREFFNCGAPIRKEGLYIGELVLLFINLGIKCKSLIPDYYFPEIRNYQHTRNNFRNIMTNALNIASANRKVVYKSILRANELQPGSIKIIPKIKWIAEKHKNLFATNANYLIANANCSELYGIKDEVWRHYVVLRNYKSASGNNWRICYDSYKDEGKDDYGEKWEKCWNKMLKLDWLQKSTGAIILV